MLACDRTTPTARPHTSMPSRCSTAAWFARVRQADCRDALQHAKALPHRCALWADVTHEREALAHARLGVLHEPNLCDGRSSVSSSGSAWQCSRRVLTSAMSPATENVASRSASVASKARPPTKISVAAWHTNGSQRTGGRPACACETQEQGLSASRGAGARRNTRRLARATRHSGEARTRCADVTRGPASCAATRQRAVSARLQQPPASTDCAAAPRLRASGSAGGRLVVGRLFAVFLVLLVAIVVGAQALRSVVRASGVVCVRRLHADGLLLFVLLLLLLVVVFFRLFRGSGSSDSATRLRRLVQWRGGSGSRRHAATGGRARRRRCWHCTVCSMRWRRSSFHRDRASARERGLRTVSTFTTPPPPSSVAVRARVCLHRHNAGHFIVESGVETMRALPRCAPPARCATAHSCSAERPRCTPRASHAQHVPARTCRRVSPLCAAAGEAAASAPDGASPPPETLASRVLASMQAACAGGGPGSGVALLGEPLLAPDVVFRGEFGTKISGAASCSALLHAAADTLLPAQAVTHTCVPRASGHPGTAPSLAPSSRGRRCASRPRGPTQCSCRGRPAGFQRL